MHFPKFSFSAISCWRICWRGNIIQITNSILTSRIILAFEEIIYCFIYILLNYNSSQIHKPNMIKRHFIIRFQFKNFLIILKSFLEVSGIRPPSKHMQISNLEETLRRAILALLLQEIEFLIHNLLIVYVSEHFKAGLHVVWADWKFFCVQTAWGIFFDEIYNEFCFLQHVTNARVASCFNTYSACVAISQNTAWMRRILITCRDWR